MSDPTIYHGTPLTPRAALMDVCAGRAMCVSFHRPDDVGAAEAISPAIMYDNGAFSFWREALRSGQEWAEDRDWTPFLSLARTAPVHTRPMGRDPGCTGGTFPAQRRTAERLAVRAERRPPVAYGRTDRAPAAPLRALRSRMPRMDGARHRPRLRGMVPPDGRGCGRARQPLAGPSHDARRAGRAGIPLRQRGCDQWRTERSAI